MNAQKLFDTFTKSTDPKIILKTAYEIQTHFESIENQKPSDFVGTNISWIIKNEKPNSIVWLLLSIIVGLDKNRFERNYYILSSRIDASSETYALNITQCKWTYIILKEILPLMNNDDAKKCDILIAKIDKKIKNPLQIENQKNQIYRKDNSKDNFERNKLHKSNDVLLPVQLINHIVLMGNTMNKAEVKWWNEVGLATAFANYNNELIHALSSKHKETIGCVSNHEHPELVKEVASFLKEKYPNDSHIYQIGAVGSSGKTLCNVVFAISFSTVDGIKPFETIITLPNKIMPSDRLEYPT